MSGHIILLPCYEQGALPRILESTKEDFFLKIIEILRESADLCYAKIQEIPSITCPSKPEGSMFVMVSIMMIH